MKRYLGHLHLEEHPLICHTIASVEERSDRQGFQLEIKKLAILKSEMIMVITYATDVLVEQHLVQVFVAECCHSPDLQDD